MKGKTTVSYRNGPQVMVKGFGLKGIGYRRGARVTVRDLSVASTNPPWIYVVDNDDTTLVSRDPLPHDWVQPGVDIEIDVQDPTRLAPRESADANPGYGRARRPAPSARRGEPKVTQAKRRSASPIAAEEVDETSFLREITAFRRLGEERAMFDCYAFADYRGDAQDAAGGVVLAVAIGSGAVRLIRGVSTRRALALAFPRLLLAANGAGLRVLFGQDHQYSIPAALAEELGLDTASWRGSMRKFFDPRTFSGDAQSGRAGRFALSVNAWLVGKMLPPYFWTGQQAGYGIPRNNPREANHRSQRRLTEAGTGFPFCRIGDKGSVGGQSIVGIPRLLRLLDDCEHSGIPVRVWPFDGLALDSVDGHVAIEPYPSLVRAEGVLQSDANDAIASTIWAQRLDREGDLGRALDLTGMSPGDRKLVTFEGWLAGA